MKILFVDINGTITRSKDGSPFTPENDPTAIELIPGVATALDRHAGSRIFGISNQGGIGAGKRTFNSVIAEMQHTLTLAPQIHHIFFCPDFAGLELWHVDRIGVERRDQFHEPLKGKFRKPDPGMILAAMKSFNSIRGEGLEFLFVGDREEDYQAAIAADIPFQHAEVWRGDKSPF